LLRIERGAWPKVAEAVHGPVAESVASSGGSIFGLWRGEIGWHTDEGALMTAWPSGEFGHPTLEEIPGVAESSAERVDATVRPLDPTPPTESGIYAHRWFEIASDDWPEFVELSQGAWPDFEAAFAARIVGFWRSVDSAAGQARVLLVTRYPSLASWERSRPYSADPVEGVQEARRKFLRRAELTKRTIVRISRLVGPA
jgi:hypothetical protein